MKTLEARIAVVLGALVAAATTASAATVATSDLFEVLPADTTAVAVVKLGELRSAPLYRSFEEQCLFRHGRADFDDFVRATGIDPAKDIDETLVAVRGQLGDDGPGGTVGMVRGRFDEADLTQRLLASGAPLTRVDADGVDVFRFTHDGKQTADALAFPTATLAVFGDEQSVVAVCKAIRSGRTGLPKDSGLRAAFDGARHTGQVWGALQTKPLLRTALDRMDKKPAPLQALATLDWLSFDADFGSDLRLSASGQASNGDDAELVRQSLDGFLAFAKLGAKEDAELLSALAEVAIERQGDRVTLTTTVPGELLLRRTAGRHGEGASGARTHDREVVLH